MSSIKKIFFRNKLKQKLLKNMRRLIVLAAIMMIAIVTFAQSKDDPKEQLITSLDREGHKFDFGTIYLKIDNNGNYYIGLYDGPHSIFKVYEGGRLFLKLDNDEILTLKNSKTIQVFSEYDRYGNKLWDETRVFYLSDKDLKALKQHKICKMRAEIRGNVTDIMRSDLSKDYDFATQQQKVYNKYLEKTGQKRRQEELNANPLLDF